MSSIWKICLVLGIAGCFYHELSAQVAPPAAYSNTVRVNYVREWDAKAPDQDPAHLVTRPVSDVGRITQYVDGLGRSLQTVDWQASPQGRDLVTAVTYDPFSREQYNYLPFASTVVTAGQDLASDGNFKLNPFQQQASFMQSQYSGETFYYRQASYEASPMNRLLTIYNAGNSWVGASRGVTSGYLINTISDSVQVWNIKLAQGSLPVNSGQYMPGTLYKNVTTDEQNHQVIEYNDKSGHLVLKKVQLSASPGTAHIGWLNTYYVYDSLENLRFAISPRAVELINTGSTWSVSQSIADELCLRYEYDSRNRMIIKKVAGAGEVWMVYDARDRLVMTQDANLRTLSPAKWLVTEYDALNRPWRTGLLTDANNRAYHQNLAYSSSAYPNTTANYEILIQTHYDNYAWTGSSSLAVSAATQANLITTYNTAPYYAQAPVSYLVAQGMVTGKMIKVLGTANQYLNTINYYDDHGRLIQTQSANYTGGTDTVTTQYNFSGLPLRVIVNHQKNGNTVQHHDIATKINYDANLRVKAIWKNIDGATGDQLIDSIKYDELGRLRVKKLDSDIDSMVYEYNIRGWLTGINKNYVKGTESHYFGMELGYDKSSSAAATTSYANPSFNGNIAGTTWKSAGDGVGRKYDYVYDNASRLTSANFTQNTSGSSWDSAYMNFNVGLGYDANGNILAMGQSGFKVGGSGLIDKLTYTYLPNSNKLTQVTDAYNDQNSKLGDFHYNPATKGTTDYSYDGNGNLSTDNNKAIDNISYNYLNLPQQVHIKGKGNIVYTYDAAGKKLQKLTGDSTAGKAITTLYMDGFVYQRSGPIASPTAGIDTLQFLDHEEGRERWALHRHLNGTTGYGWEKDYFEKDHLGNTRAVLSLEKDTAQYVATMEAANRNTESQLFSNMTAYARNQAPGYPADVTVTNPNDSVVRVNGNGPKTGPGIILKVMSGDKIDVAVQYYYNNVTGTSGNNLSASDLLASLATGIVSLTGAAHGALSDLNTTSSPVYGALTSFLSANNPSQPGKPQAYLNWILLDDQFKYVSSYPQSGAIPVGAFGTTAGGTLQTPLAYTGIPVTKSGYLYVYVSNATPGWDVFFDNLSVKQYSGTLLEETHYYPFGLAMAAISDKALKTPYAENKLEFNGGNELQNKEFSDGSGMEAYDATFRVYDAQIGRFWQADPLGELAEDCSPYSFSLDNPIYFNDPLGLDADDNSTVIFPDPRKVPVQPPICLSCQLPKPDPGGSVGPPPSNVPPPIDYTQQFVPWMDKIGDDLATTHGLSEVFDPTCTMADNALKYTKTDGWPGSTPWCAAYGSFTLHNSGFNQPRSASSGKWLTSDKLKKAGPYFGAIAIFKDYKDPGLKHPTGSGHIGFLFGFMRGGKYIILGGNQGDRLKFSAYPITSVYLKEIKGYMHLEGFYFPSDYHGPRQIAPLYQSDRALNRISGVLSNSNTTK